MRFGQDKLTSLIHGEPLICYSLRAFAEAPSISSILLVVSPTREKEFSEIIAAMNHPTLQAMTIIVAGGSSRHQSVRRGIGSLSSSTQYVAIHDAARPLITSDLIEHALQQGYYHGAASLAVPVTDTLHRINENGYAKETVDRDQLWSMQTPQIFRVVDLINHLTMTGVYQDQGFEKQPPTDEVSALLKHGVNVHLVENREPNIKVTYPADLRVVATLLKDLQG